MAGRLTWRAGRLAGARFETPTACTLVLQLPGWPGHLPGQHVDVRLTAPDGYTAQRSYSIASVGDAAGVELTVQRIPDGEVSTYLTDVLRVGDPLEVRGPVGGWFVWRDTDPAPVQLIAGGSGIVPLMAMIRARAAASSSAPFRLVYSTRTPEDVYYAGELDRRAGTDTGLCVRHVYTRRAPAGWPEPVGRLNQATLSAYGLPPERAPVSYVCGPTGFVEAAADLLVASGHDPARIRTERFGGA